MLHTNRRKLVTGLAAATAVAGLVRPSYAQGQMAPAAPAAPAAAPSGPYKLEPLPYAPEKNEPHIDKMTMEIHHGRHNAAFVNTLNANNDKLGGLAGKPVNELLNKLNEVPEAVRTLVRNNAGGHANHTMFWQVMGGSGGEPTGAVKAAIDSDLGGYAKLQEDFNGAGARVFGSGWVFITVSKDGKLAMVSKPGQDSPLMDNQMVLFGNDVWEHAYYLKYQNRRADYLKAWWNVLDWSKINQRYAAAKAGTLTI